MMAANYSNVRENFKSYCDKVNDNNETIIITRKDNKNVVMISEKEYNKILKSIDILRDPEYLIKLCKSIKEID